jgi:hypothetical protein
MRTAYSTNGKAPKDRLSLKLVMVFAVAFLGTLALMLVSGLLTAIVEGQAAAAESEIATPPIVIDPKIQSDLARAMSFDAVPASAEVQNPFVDRAGIGGNALLTNAGPVAVNQTASPAAAASTGSKTSTLGGPQPMRSTTTVGGTATAIGPMMDAGAATKMRYDDRMERVNRGDYVGPESEVFSIDDLLPVGYASGGDRGDEVIFFSLSLCRTFSFPAGTRFFDGWLNSFNQGEVIFAVQGGLRHKSYASTSSCRGTDQTQSYPTGSGLLD